ncbi:uncharacterized protein LOC121418627 [Lytechinus variegatus]|uniref:uncharacterized protein LOC121418627 n=1 Tax=Lytechinus variegatus TaxID=7654 RepID=UPI001BB1A25E|nr:uncharacterized protein LOC121418627 [Lytechinus variegatus]
MIGIGKPFAKMFPNHICSFDEVDGAQSSHVKMVAKGCSNIYHETLSNSPSWKCLPLKCDSSLQESYQYHYEWSNDSPSSLASSCQSPDLDFNRSDGNHSCIGGPIISEFIGPEGGKLELYGNVLTIPRGAVSEKTKFELGLVWNKCLMPSFETDCQITSILSCQPSGVRFHRPVILSLPHCLERNLCSSKQMRPVLYSSHHVSGGKPTWSRYRVPASDYSLENDKIHVKVFDFCYLVWAFDDDRPDVEAKRMRIVPYASPISAGQDQKIRLHVIDDLEAVKEKVKKEEEELGGKRLTSYHSYVFLKNQGNLKMEISWHSVGWVLCSSPMINVPFREMWACDHNSSELQFNHQGQNSDFKCRIDIHQVGNDSKVTLSFAHDVQTDSSDRSEGVAVERRVDVMLSMPREETRSVRPSAVQLQLPKVPPLPDIPLLSLTATNGMTPRQQHLRSSPAELGANQKFQFSFGAVSLHGDQQSFGVPSIERANALGASRPDQVEGLDLVSRRETSHYGKPSQNKEMVSAINNLNLNHSYPTRDTSGNNKALNQYYIGNVNVHVPERADQRLPHMSWLVESRNIIPFQLKKQLSVKLSELEGVRNWMDLSRYWKLDKKYDAVARTESKSPSFTILCLAEERKIVRSLDDLRTALKAIDRDDCVDLVDDYEGISRSAESDSDL